MGRIRKDIINSILEKYPELADILSPDKEILFWRDRVKHTERHRKDFPLRKNMNFALNEFPGLSDIPITSVFTQTKTVFHLSANLRIMFLSQCDCLQMAAWLIEPCTR